MIRRQNPQRLNPRDKDICASSLLKMLTSLGILLLSVITVSAQNAPQPNPEGPVQVDCKQPQNQNERYSCFIEIQNRNLLSAADNKIQQEDAQKILVNRLIQRDSELIQQRLQKKLEVQNAIENSRRRNVSHKGQSYQVTYGRVTEPRTR